jgi:hypothetical protein
MRYGVGLMIVLLLAGGCASPPARYYRLSPANVPAAAPSHGSVAVGPVSIPALVDRPQIVVSAGPNEVRVDEFNRWASPLADDIARVVAENLFVMLGTPRVMLYSQGTADDAQFRVAIGVQRFDSAPGEAASLDAVWSVQRRQDGASESGRTMVREPVAGEGYDALAAAHSRALERLSRDIANAIGVFAKS